MVVAMVLSGCAASSTPPANDPNVPALTATATTGVIRGVVVDEAIRPIPNATVLARGPGAANRTVVTGADGAFGLAELAPGTWFVSASKIAYTPVQQSIEVAAGVGDPPVTKLQMVFVPGQAPFLNEIKIDAFIECIVPGANVCAIANLYPCVFAGYCNNATSDTSFVLLYGPLVQQNRIPDWLQTEVIWETTQSVSDGLGIRYSAHEPADGTNVDDRVGGASGRSPIVMRMDHNMTTVWETGTKKGVGYEIFGWTEALSPLGSAGFVLNQRVSFFFDIFYGYTPPADWQFSVDGAYPPPR